MSTTSSNTAPNAADADSNGGGRVRQHEERTREMAPPEAVGTFRRSMQSSFISKFTGQRCQLQPVEHKVQRVAAEESVAATLQTHPKVQMHPLLQRNAMSPSNGSKNSLLNMLAKKHNEAVQRAMEEDAAGELQVKSGEAESGNKAEPEKIDRSIQKSEGAKGEEAVSPSASSAPESPEVQTNISPTGDADKDVQAQPKGPHRTRADPAGPAGPAGPVRVRSTGSENAAVQMDGKEDIAQQSETEEANGNAVSTKNKYVQAKGQQQSGTPALESDLKSSKGAGTPMADADRGFFESRMGADFSNVRIHTGFQAVQMNEGLGAKAFAHGSDIYFNANQYQPGTSTGKHLLAHELTHTVQQGGASLRKSEERESESGGNAIQRSGIQLGERSRAVLSQPKGIPTNATPGLQASCASCASQEASVQKSEDETAAPKIQAKCATCEAEAAAAPKLSRTSNSNSELNLQRMLKIGQPGDKYEQEADTTADKVMRMGDVQVAPSHAVNTEADTVSPKSKFPAIPEIEKPEIPQQGKEMADQAKTAGAENEAATEKVAEETAKEGQSKGKEKPKPVKFDLKPPKVDFSEDAVQTQIQRWTPEPNNTKTEPNPTNPKDGPAVESKSTQRIKDDPDVEEMPTSTAELDEDEKEKADNPDRGEVRSEKSATEASGVNKPPVNRGEQATEKATEQAAETKEKATENEGAAEVEGERKDDKKSEFADADAAATARQDYLTKAATMPIPATPPAFIFPKIEVPKDSAGEDLPRRGDIDTKVRGYAYMGEMIRAHGYELLKFSHQMDKQADESSAAIEQQKEDLAYARTGTDRFREQHAARSEIAEKSKTAHTEAVDRENFVKQEAPGLAEEADKGGKDSGDLKSDANDKASQAKSEEPDDEDARADAEQQTGEMKETADGAASVDDAITQTGERARQYLAEAEASGEKNKESGQKIAETDALLQQTDGRINDMAAKNEESNAQIEAVAQQPDVLRQFAVDNTQNGKGLILASFVMEAELQSIQDEYLSKMAGIEPKEVALKRKEEEEKKKAESGGIPEDEAELMKLAAMPEPEQQATVEAMPEEKKTGLLATLDKMVTVADDKGTDATEGARKEFKSGLQDKLMGTPEADPRQEQIQAVEDNRISRLGGVRAIADANFGVLTEAEKATLSQKLVAQSIADDIGAINVLQMGKEMIKGMIDPRQTLVGVIDGFDKFATGIANIFNPEAWAKDPLGNLLQVGADITTGLAMIFSSILGIAGMITALMVAITIISWGFASPVTMPVIGWMGTVMTYAGWGAIIAGSLSVLFNYYAYIKNLSDAAAAQSSDELFGETEQMKQNASDAFTGAMAVVEGVGAVKMAPGMKSPKNMMPDFKNVTPKQWVKQLATDTASGVKNLPANIAKGAKALYAKGKKGLLEWKEKIKGWFKGKKQGGDVDLIDHGVPAKSGIPDKELGQNVKRQYKGSDGHTYKVLDDGTVVKCTTCRTLRMRHGEWIESDPNLKARLQKIENDLKADPTDVEAIKAYRELDAEIEDLKIKHGVADPMEVDLLGDQYGYMLDDPDFKVEMTQIKSEIKQIQERWKNKSLGKDGIKKLKKDTTALRAKLRKTEIEFNQKKSTRSQSFQVNGKQVSYRSETDLISDKKHGIDWDEGQIKGRILRDSESKVQGKFGTYEDIESLPKVAARNNLEVPSDGNFYDWPENIDSKVYRLNAQGELEWVHADKVFIKVREDGTIHAYPYSSLPGWQD